MSNKAITETETVNQFTDLSDLFATANGLNVPHLDQYLGVWAISTEGMYSRISFIRNVDLHQHIHAHMTADGMKQIEAQSRDEQGYEVVRGGVAVINAVGTLQKRASSFSGATSTIRMRRAIRNAANDDSVSGILLRIDSPGGTAAGTADLADDIKSARAHKPVYAYIEDLGASAAFWIASQADKVYSNRTAIVGSIGTYAVLYDMSQMAENEGVKVHVIRAGEFKGAGEPGTEITQQQLDEFQSRVEEINEHFVRGVSAGRKMSLARTRELADGRVHIGQRAVELGLIDGIQSLDETITALSKARSKRTMSQTSDTSAGETKVEHVDPAASIDQIKAACPNCDSEFVLSQLERKATVSEAQTAWIAKQQEKLQAAEAAKAEAEEKAKQAETPKPGVKALGTGGTDQAASFDGDPIVAWNEAVENEMKVTRGNRQRAASNANRKNPGLREAMIEAHNAAHGRNVA